MQDCLKNPSLNDDEILALKEKANKLCEEIKQAKENADSSYQEIKQAKENANELYQKIEQIKENAKNSYQDQEEKLSELSQEYHKLLAEDGAKTKLLAIENEFKDFQAKYDKSFKAYEEQIKSLLESSATVGLAKAYKEERKRHEAPIKEWKRVIFISIISLLALNILPSLQLSFPPIVLPKLESKELFSFLLVRLALCLPLLILIYYALKKSKEESFLRQSYAHKEALALSYISYKNQIEELGLEDKELLEKQIKESLSAFTLNPARELKPKNKGLILSFLEYSQGQKDKKE